MKKLFFLAAALTLLGCKTSKNADCDAYGSTSKSVTANPKISRSCYAYADCVICVDSVKCETIHVHFYHHDSCEWSCLYLPEEEYVIVDTFYYSPENFHVDVKN